MKQIQKIGLVLAIMVFLSSCGSLSVTRMRYNRGLNIDWFGGKDGSAKATVKKDKVKRSETAVAENEANIEADNNEAFEEQEITEIEKAAPSKEVAQVVNKSAVKASPAEKVKVRKSVNHRSSGVHHENKFSKKVKSAVTRLTHGNNTQQSNDSDVDLIILVILAIIPPLQLLAIYLYFGEINIHFWISLLLLLFGGWFAVGGSVGYVGLAIIHALLVVFGIFG